MTQAKTAYTIDEVRALWQLVRVLAPVHKLEDPAAEALCKDFLHFPAGTTRQTVWAWLDTQHADFNSAAAPREFHRWPVGGDKVDIHPEVRLLLSQWLREVTEHPVMECRKALHYGNLDAALDYLDSDKWMSFKLISWNHAAINEKQTRLQEETGADYDLCLKAARACPNYERAKMRVEREMAMRSDSYKAQEKLKASFRKCSYFEHGRPSEFLGVTNEYGQETHKGAYYKYRYLDDPQLVLVPADWANASHEVRQSRFEGLVQQALSQKSLADVVYRGQLASAYARDPSCNAPELMRGSEADKERELCDARLARAQAALEAFLMQDEAKALSLAMTV